MGGNGHYEEFKEPIENLAREIAQNYVRELTKEATKKAIISKAKILDKKSVILLENEIRENSDVENIDNFKETADKIYKDIHEGSIKGDKIIDQISKVLENSPGLGDYDHYKELKEPVRNIASEITHTYVREIMKEAIKKAILIKIASLTRDQIKELESEIKKKTDEEQVNQFKESSDKILKGIYEGSIKGDKKIEQIGNALKSSLDREIPPPSRGSVSSKKSRYTRKALYATPLVIFTLTVLILVVASSLAISPGNLDFELEQKRTGSDHFLVSNVGTGILIWRAYADQPWISVSPARGTNAGTLDVVVNASDMTPGEYHGTITIVSIMGKKQCNVNLSVIDKTESLPPAMIVYPSSLDFSLSSEESTFGQLQILNKGGGTLQWNVSSDTDERWINLKPTNGTNSGAVTFTVNAAGLEPDTYKGNITIKSNAGTEYRPIKLEVNVPKPPILVVQPSSLNFNLGVGESTSGQLQVSNAGGGTLKWSVRGDPDTTWINLEPANGTNSGTATFTINAAGLDPDTYKGNITIESNVGTEYCPVTMKVTNVSNPPLLVIYPYFLSVNLVEGKSASKQLQILNGGGGTLQWNVSLDSNKEWIDLSPTNGTNSGIVNVIVDTEGLEPERYEGNINIESNAGNDQRKITLVLTPEKEISGGGGAGGGGGGTVTSQPDTVDLTIDKAASPGTYSAVGDIIRYDYTVTNTGNVNITGLNVSDNRTIVTLDKNTIEPAESVKGTANYNITQADLNAGSVTNSAFANGISGNRTIASQPDITTVVSTQNSIIQIEKSSVLNDVNGDGYGQPGETVTYSFLVTNTGTVALSNIRVIDPLSGLSETTAPEGFNGSLAPGNSVTFTARYTLTSADIEAGIISNNATVTGVSSAGRSVTDTDSNIQLITQVPVNPALTINKTASPETYSAVGDLIRYAYNITNTGNVNITGLNVSDNKTGFILLNKTTIVPGESVNGTGTYNITQNDLNAGFVTNNATASGTFENRTITSQPDNVTITANITADLIIDKTASRETYSAVGNMIGYNYTVINSGNVNITGLNASDNKTGLILLNKTTLAPGESANGTANYNVTQADLNAGFVTNSAFANGIFGNRIIRSDEANATVTANITADLTLNKTTSSENYSVGSVITYNYTVNNTGNVNITGLNVSDNRTNVTLNRTTIVPGESVNGTATYNITQNDIENGSVTNSAFASGIFGNRTIRSNEASATVTANITADLTLNKTASPGNYSAVNDTIRYTYIVTNIGNVNITGLNVSDNRTGLILLDETAVAPGESANGTANYTITQADLNAGSVTNSAFANGTFGDQPVRSQPDNVTVTAIQNATININKSGVFNEFNDANNDGYSQPGETISYRFVVNNTGTVTLNNVNVTDPLPGMSAITAQEGFTGSLAPGQSVEFNAMYTLTSTDVGNGTVNNTATATGISPTGVLVNNTDTDQHIIRQNATIDINKSSIFNDENGNTFGDVEETINYSFLVNNTGTLTLTNVTVYDSLTGTPEIAEPIEEFNGILAPGQSVTFNATYALNSTDIENGTVNNTATVIGTTQTGVLVNDTDTDQHIIRQNATIDINKSSVFNDENGNTFGDVEETINYSFLVNNTGTVTLTNVTVNDSLPGMSAITATEGFTGSLSPSNPLGLSVINEFNGTLAPGESVTFNATYPLTLANLDAGMINNTATAAGISPTGVPVNDTDTNEQPIGQNPIIDINKSSTFIDENEDTYGQVGETVTYSFLVTNIGTVTLSDVGVIDPLPGMSVITASEEFSGSLAPGQSIEFTAIYTLTSGDLEAGMVNNTATAAGISPTGVPVNNTTSTTVRVNAPPVLVSPDLVASLELTGDAIQNPVLSTIAPVFTVPIRVVVRNQGNGAADIFKVSVDYTSSSGSGTAAFSVPGETDSFYPYTDAPLNPGGEVSFEGNVIFDSSFGGETVSLNATADSCTGDEIFTGYCRVNETNEENNESPAVEVALPAVEITPPAVEIPITSGEDNTTSDGSNITSDGGNSPIIN